MPVNLKQLFEQFIAPSLQRVEGQLEAMRSEIRRLDEKIDHVDEKIDNVREDMCQLRGEFRLAIDLHERIARLEASLGRH